MKTKLSKIEVAKLRPNLTRFAKSLTGNSKDSKELVQNTIAKILSSPNNSFLKIWTFNTMKNVFIRCYRKVATNNHVIDKEASQRINPQSAPIAHKKTEQKQNGSTFHMPFQNHISSSKYVEVAEKLSIKVESTKSHIHFHNKS